MTPDVRERESARISAAVTDVLERVFATVSQVRVAALRSMARPAGDPAVQGPVLDPAVARLLHERDQLAVGLGLVVAPRPRLDLPLCFQWWQTEPEGGQVRGLVPDLRPDSLGYYDYTAAEWFDVPRRTGQRHVVGPFVDVHGTGRYLLTATQPVVVDDEFLGIVGADVPVSRFETHLLSVLGSLEHAFLLSNDGGRVVLSTSARWLVGDLIGADGNLPEPAVDVPGLPWRLHLADRTASLHAG